MDMMGIVAVPVGRRFYIPVRAKFTIALLIALAWTILSLWISKPWMDQLGLVTHPLFALITITFIAYVPGFMNSFLLASLLLDRRPPRVPLPHYSGVTVLVAAYQEENTIADTLASLAAAEYPGELEILVLNDGSTDSTAQVAQRAVQELRFPDRATVQIVNFADNRGKAAVLNRGLEIARHSLIVTVDADSWLPSDSLTKIVERLVLDPPETQAVAGAVLVRNSRTNLVTRAQEWDLFPWHRRREADAEPVPGHSRRAGCLLDLPARSARSGRRLARLRR